MGTIFTYVMGMLAGNVGENIQGWVGRGTISAAWLAGVALSAFAALCCLVAALWAGISPSLGPIGASLIAAGVFLLAAIFCFWMRFRRKATKQIGATLDGLALDRQVVGLLERNAVPALAVALIGGLVAGGFFRRK